MAFTWVLIPIVAILAGAWSEWLKFKEKQTQIGASTSEIEHALEKMTAQNANLIQRVQNLEAIVTSQTWDDANADSDMARLDAPASAVAEIPASPVRGKIDFDLDGHSDPDNTDIDEVARLARRLQS